MCDSHTERLQQECYRLEERVGRLERRIEGLLRDQGFKAGALEHCRDLLQQHPRIEGSGVALELIEEALSEEIGS